MMIRKLARATVIALSLLGAAALAMQGVASAATFVPGGVYPSMHACADAGNAGFPQGRWVGWYCQDLGDGQALLWVQPSY